MKLTSVGDSHLLALTTREVGLLMAFVDTGDMTLEFPVGFTRTTGLDAFLRELYDALGDIATVAHGGCWADGTVEYVYDNPCLEDLDLLDV